MKVFVGDSGTRGTDAAVAEAAGIAEARGGSLVLFRHLLPPVRDEDAAGHGELITRERRRLDDRAEDLRAAHGIEVTPILSQSSERASRVILRLLEELDIDLLVIAGRKRTSIGKLLLGSTASDLLLGADCPVLQVPVPPEATSSQ